MSSCDWAFGPRVDISCRAFDFTLYFEDIFLSAVPYSVFILLLPLSLSKLAESRRVVNGGKLLACKSVVFFSLAILQALFIAFRIRNTNLQTKASLATDIIGLVAVIGAGFLSWFQHYRSEQPSTLLAIFLSASFLTGIARVRTLWLMPNAVGPAVVLTLVLVQTLLGLLLESLSKRTKLRVPEKFAESGPEPFTGFWNLVGFTWLLGTLRQGYQRVLSIHDLPALDYRLDSNLIHGSLETTWSKYDKTKQHSLLKACFHAYSIPFLGAVLPRLCLSGFTFAQPFLIKSLISYISEKDAAVDRGKGLIGAYALVYIGIAASTAVYWYHTYRFLIRLRGGLIYTIYQQTVRARAVDLGAIDGLTLMGTDVERIVVGFRTIHELWASIVEITIAVYLLKEQVYVACLVPGVIVLVFVLGTFQLSAWAKTSQKLWVEKVEQRLGVTNSSLVAMRVVKMLGLSNKIYDIITEFRRVEIICSSRFRQLLIGKIFFSNSPRILAPMVTFAVLVGIARAKNDNSILAGQAFTSLSLIALLTTPALTFIQAIPSMIQCLGSFERIQEYCRQPVSSRMSDQANDEPAPAESMNHQQHHIVKFRNQSFAWTKSGSAVLKSLDVEIATGRITVVLGPTGSGKSTLLESILGETVGLGSGQTERNFRAAAYCSQVPWLTNGTIRENITGGTNAGLDDKWYASVLWACGLEDDVVGLERGDQTLVGNGGSRLSGGQRQRVSLARSVYSRCQFLLLDDVFSGVDARNVALISDRLLGPAGLLRNTKTTVLLVCHSPSLVSLADDVIVVQDGTILESGSLETLRASNGYTSFLDIQESDRSLQRNISTPTAAKIQTAIETSDRMLSNLNREASDLKAPNSDFSIYQYYVRAAGRSIVVAYFTFTLLWLICDDFSVVVVDWWSSANKKSPSYKTDNVYLGAYAALSFASPMFMCISCWLLFVKIISNTARNLHNDLLRTIIAASLRFFQETDSGSITNRFSQDMELIGMDLPITAANYIATACECACKIVLLAVFGRYLSVALPLVLGSVFLIQRFYLRTSRQVRLLDIEAKAPVYLLFLETASGASTIRAFGWEHLFKRVLEARLDWSQRPVYVLYCIQQWLTLVLDLIVAMLAVILVIIIVTWRDAFGPGAVGVSLVTVMTFSNALTRLVTYWAALETSVGAVGRIKTFVENTPTEEEELQIPHPISPPTNWPTAGAINYSNVVATYKPDDAAVLKNITLSIQAGEKVAICGGSGSGKTSFILSLLHMINFKGAIDIDGVDISNLTPSELRLRINVVPQEPFLMPGSIRFNIDPFGNASDESIIVALQRLHLWDRITSLGGLDSQTSLSSWSVGERQLLCLARAMLRRGHILILDEATSSVDPVTESVMQDVIDTEFSKHTVLAVVHRLGYIDRFDKVAVLDRGTLVEYDSPGQLLARPSILADLQRASMS